MCDFEDMPIISKYPLGQAILDGVLVRIGEHNGKPVVATSHIRAQFEVADLLKIFHKFEEWDKHIRPGLPEEEQLFSMVDAGRKVWVIEDAQAYTIMYPEDY